MAEVEFRDGKREVPDHVKALMQGIPTYKMTYEESIAEANRRMLDHHVVKAQQGMIDGHFKR